MQFNTYLTSIQETKPCDPILLYRRLLAGVAGVKGVGVEWFTRGPDFGGAPNVNKEQCWVIASISR